MIRFFFVLHVILMFEMAYMPNGPCVLLLHCNLYHYDIMYTHVKINKLLLLIYIMESASCEFLHFIP
jgi:hypothetical protein